MGGFNGAGQYIRFENWAQDAANGVLITTNHHDAEDNGFAAGLSNCITRDGQSPPTANLPMGNFKLTGLAAGSAPGDSVNYTQTITALAASTGAAMIGTADGTTVQAKASILKTVSLPATDLLQITMPSRPVATFSTGGSYGVGNFSDGQPVNIHGGDDGTTTRVSAVRASTSPLFIGYTDRPKGEGGGDVGKTICSFEGYRLSNVDGQQEVGAVRIVADGSTSAQYGGAITFLTKIDSSTTFAERTRMSMRGDWSFGVDGGTVGPRGNYVTGSRAITVTGNSGTANACGVFEGCGAQSDILSMECHLSGIHNYNTAGEKQVGAVRIYSVGATAGDRGGEVRIYAKQNGSPASLTSPSLTIAYDGVVVAGKFGCNGTAAQGKVTLPTDAVDPATSYALVNAIKALLIANGQAA